jgi:hypothetical protein
MKFMAFAERVAGHLLKVDEANIARLRLPGPFRLEPRGTAG